MGRTHLKVIFFSLITTLTMIPAIVVAADDKPSSFSACMQSDTAETREQIFTACERSAQTSNVARYTIDMTLRMKERNANSDGERRELQNDAIAQKKPHYYYGGLAYMRQAELVEKVESEQGKPKNTARYCWFIQEAWRQMASANGDFNGDLQGRRRKAIVRSNECKKMPRQIFNASEAILDTGDLMSDIAELKTCLGPVTPDSMFDVYYACHIADSKTDMLAFRKAGVGVGGPMSGGSSLDAVYIAMGKIKYRQVELWSRLDSKNMFHMCNLIRQADYKFGQVKRTLAPGSVERGMQAQAQHMTASCQQRGL